ncbi:MAG: Rpp14/Pop5 family protein [Candidatus Micrarchaeota archaeon]|nr:Rpp14/Pop5 family protein [Candidatus Micrarchaeota archaeon]
MVRASALKKRYILFEIKSDSELKEEDVKHGVYNEALRFFGEFGLSKISLKFIDYDSVKKLSIFRCARDHYKDVLGFLALVNSLNGKKARTIAKRASGTIKSLKTTKSISP